MILFWRLAAGSNLALKLESSTAPSTEAWVGEGAVSLGRNHLEGTPALKGWLLLLCDSEAQELELVQFIFNIRKVPKVPSRSPPQAISANLCWTLWEKKKFDLRSLGTLERHVSLRASTL